MDRISFAFWSAAALVSSSSRLKSGYGLKFGLMLEILEQEFLASSDVRPEIRSSWRCASSNNWVYASPGRLPPVPYSELSFP